MDSEIKLLFIHPDEYRYKVTFYCHFSGPGVPQTTLHKLSDMDSKSGEGVFITDLSVGHIHIICLFLSWVIKWSQAGVILVLVLLFVRVPDSGNKLHAETGSAKQDAAHVGAKDCSDQQLR